MSGRVPSASSACVRFFTTQHTAVSWPRLNKSSTFQQLSSSLLPQTLIQSRRLTVEFSPVSQFHFLGLSTLGLRLAIGYVFRGSGMIR